MKYAFFFLVAVVSALTLAALTPSALLPPFATTGTGPLGEWLTTIE